MPSTDPVKKRSALGTSVVLATAVTLVGGLVWQRYARVGPLPPPAPPSSMGSSAVAPPPVAATEQHRVAPPSDPRAPFTTLANLQYWCFTQEQSRFACRTVLRARRASRSAIAPIRMPSYADVALRDLRCSPNARIVEVRHPPQSQGYSSIQPLLLPLAPAREGERLVLDVGWTEARVPYLHDTPAGSHRLLSLSQGRTQDDARTVYTFAIPDSCSGVQLTDLQPTRQTVVPGWKVFVYDITGLAHSTIHLAFDFGPATRPPPAADAVFAAYGEP